MRPPLFALTQGDPAGIGPEILLKLLSEGQPTDWRPLLIAERPALEALRDSLPHAPWERLAYIREADLSDVPEGKIPVLDPVGSSRQVTPGSPGADDAEGAMAALDAGIDLARRGRVEALVTAPLNKAEIARHLDRDFRGHTDYLATACGLGGYGHDYLMAFLAPGLRVALLSTHVSLREALSGVTHDAVLGALRCLSRHVEGRIAVAGLNPHTGEGGLMGDEDDTQVRPAVVAARAEGIDAHGPESADSLFARAREGAFDWVLALYHDQGLIAVKTAAFGEATNWSLGLPFIRTSVDHGTAYDIAGQNKANAKPLRAAVEATRALVAGRRAPEMLQSGAPTPPDSP